MEYIHTFKHLPQAALPTGPTGPQKAAQPYLLRHDNDLFLSWAAHNTLDELKDRYVAFTLFALWAEASARTQNINTKSRRKNCFNIVLKLKKRETTKWCCNSGVLLGRIEVGSIEVFVIGKGKTWTRVFKGGEICVSQGGLREMQNY